MDCYRISIRTIKVFACATTTSVNSARSLCQTPPGLCGAYTTNMQNEEAPMTGRTQQLCATAQYIAAGRSMERELPSHERLFDDPYAATFAGDIGRKMLAAVAAAAIPIPDQRQAQQILAKYVAIRTAWLDHCVRRAMWNFAPVDLADDCKEASRSVAGSNAPVKQLVLLGVGGDCRSIRLAQDFPCGVTCFEVDLPEVMAFRETVFAQTPKQQGGVDARVEAMRARQAKFVSVGADLSEDATVWTKLLKSQGYNPALPSVWVLEGLLMYMSQDKASALLRHIRELMPPGSRLFMDVLGSATMNNRVILEVWTRYGAAPLWGTDTPGLIAADCLFEANSLVFGQTQRVCHGRLALC